MDDTILAASGEAGIDENRCLIDNQSTGNSFINGKYFLNIRDVLINNIYVSIVTQD